MQFAFSVLPSFAIQHCLALNKPFCLQCNALRPMVDCLGVVVGSQLLLTLQAEQCSAVALVAAVQVLARWVDVWAQGGHSNL